MRKLSEGAQAELDALCDENDGLLKAQDVVEFARTPDTFLHAYFTWDDGEAAEQWRMVEARSVLRVYVIKVQADPKVIDVNIQPVRGFLSSPLDRKHAGGGYRRTMDIMRDETFRAAQIDLAKRELMGFRTRYKHLQELAEVVSAIDRLIGEDEGQRAAG